VQRDVLLSQPNPSDADVQKLIDDTGQFERDASTMETRFINRISSQLTATQILRVQQFNRKFFDERLPDLLQRAKTAAGVKAQRQGPAGERQRPAAAAKQNPNRPNAGKPGNALRGKIQNFR
jgi:hypothetical protein